MPTLPDWVLRYKTKGIYAKRVKAGYALYRGHSERVEGKAYPVFRCDEYLGIVTEREGLVPPRPPVRAGIQVLRYGFSRVAESSCEVLRRNPKRLGLDANLLYVKAVLGLEGKENQAGYEGSWLSILFPGLEMGKDLGPGEDALLSRLRAQVASKLGDGFGDDLDEMTGLASEVYAVHVNGGWHVSDVPPRLGELALRHGVSFELGGGEHGIHDTQRAD